MIKVVPATWELLLEDETSTKFAKEARQAEMKIEIVKAYMKKLPIKEKIAKFIELKQLSSKSKISVTKSRKEMR